MGEEHREEALGEGAQVEDGVARAQQPRAVAGSELHPGEPDEPREREHAGRDCGGERRSPALAFEQGGVETAAAEEHGAVEVVRMEEQHGGGEETEGPAPLPAVDPRVGEQARQREERRERIPAALAREDQERNREGEEEPGRAGGQAIAPQLACERPAEEHASDAEQREGKPRGEGRRPEDREAGGYGVEREPGVPTPHAIRADLGAELLGEVVRPIAAEGDPVLEDRACEQRRLRFVLPEVLVPEIREQEGGRERGQRAQDGRVSGIGSHAPHSTPAGRIAGWLRDGQRGDGGEPLPSAGP